MRMNATKIVCNPSRQFKLLGIVLPLFLVVTTSCKTPSTFPHQETSPNMTMTDHIHENSLADFQARVLEEIKQTEEKLDCKLGVSLQDGQLENLQVSHNGDDLFHAASTMKTPVMIEVFRRSETGEFSMNDTLLVDATCTSFLDNSTFEVDAREYMTSKLGQQETILNITEQMMVVSDNLATNMMIRLVGASNITQTIRQLGVTKGYVVRGVEDIPAYEAGFSNRMTPDDLNVMLKAIEEGRAGNPESTLEMKRILLAQQYSDMIPKYLPDFVEVGHKTGSITGHRHDSAIIYAPFGTYYLTILSQDLKDPEEGKDAIAKLSLFIYEELGKLKSVKN